MLLHFKRYDFTQPKGFLLHGPPGCGKTLIGQATAASLGQLMSEKTNAPLEKEVADMPSFTHSGMTGGVFLHVKGPGNIKYVGRRI